VSCWSGSWKSIVVLESHSNDFPVLSHIARKYLTASASLVAVNIFHNGTHYEQPTFKAPAV